MSKGKDFFKTYFNIVAGLEVKNESQAIAKEVVLSEIENLQEENQQLKEEIEEYKNPIKYFKYANKNVTEENQQLKEQLLVTQNNEETFRLEMEDITQILGLDENALFDDVKAYARSLKNNWNTLKEWLYEEHYLYVPEIARNSTYQAVLDKMQELERGVSDENQNK